MSEKGHPTFGRDYDGPIYPEVDVATPPCSTCAGHGTVKGMVMPKKPTDPAPFQADIPCPDCEGAGRVGRSIR